MVQAAKCLFLIYSVVKYFDVIHTPYKIIFMMVKDLQIQVCWYVVLYWLVSRD
jgi:hypothetical protein